uniref:Uncharacterized protein n=1 Tax=Romanomermis culicivorax TaxID=13658 RepID=A0A915K6K9_ROMCU
MQQLISTTATATDGHNPPTPRPPPVSSPFHSEETRDIYIPNKTLRDTEPAQVFGRLPIQVKPKAPSTDTLYNNEFSRTTCDYPPDDYYDHLQPRYKMLRTSHREEDSHIKTIVDNMHPLIIDGAATNKRL